MVQQPQMMQPQVAVVQQPQVAVVQQPQMMQPGQPVGKFQIQLSGQWKDYDKAEDQILKRAYLTGFPKAKFHLRGQDYEYDFQKMAQINVHSRKERPIRPPPMVKPPAQPLVPPGPTMVVVVPQNPQGMMMVPHPQLPGEQIQVQVPPGAKPGQNMVVPVPKKQGMGVAGKAAV